MKTKLLSRRIVNFGVSLSGKRTIKFSQNSTPYERIEELKRLKGDR